jgi:hypothetical protein
MTLAIFSHVCDILTFSNPLLKGRMDSDRLQGEKKRISSQNIFMLGVVDNL